MKQARLLPALLLSVSAAALSVQASSHREAPGITKSPKVDGTDFYLFRSYEPGRENYVTFVANYIPLQDAYGGPNYFTLDPDAVYEIHVDNDGNAVEDITFQFRPSISRKNIAVPAGGVNVAIPLINAGAIGPNASDTGALNVEESYSLFIIRGDRRTGDGRAITDMATGGRTFKKPVDNIGRKSVPEYAAYANDHVYDIDIPGCQAGRVFVGQRKDSFYVNLGETFDLVNITNPLGAPDVERDDLEDKNVTSFVLEVPLSCLTAGDPVIGAWTTASFGVADPGPAGPPPCPAGMPGTPRPAPFFVETSDCRGWVPDSHPLARGRSDFGPRPRGTQVSRLSAPLVNEVVIGLKDKDRFNASEPKDDSQFATYVTNPALPELLEILFGGAGVRAPNLFPRTDLVAAFLTGVSGLNRPARVVPAEMMRLNTNIAPTPAAAQHPLGVIGGDNAGFPNGRRPIDDVVDIELRVAMGRLITLGLFGTPADAPSGGLDFTDGTLVAIGAFSPSFPYLATPIAGSPNATPASN